MNLETHSCVRRVGAQGHVTVMQQVKIARCTTALDHSCVGKQAGRDQTAGSVRYDPTIVTGNRLN